MLYLVLTIVKLDDKLFEVEVGYIKVVDRCWILVVKSVVEYRVLVLVPEVDEELFLKSVEVDDIIYVELSWIVVLI